MTAGRVLIAAFVALIVGGPFVAPPYYIVLFSYVGMATLTALGLVLLTGVAGQVSFGQSAFVGVSAYTAACVTTMAGLSPWLALPICLAMTAFSALVIGGATLRLSGHYLAVATIAWGVSLSIVFANVRGLGGHSGIGGIPTLSPFAPGWWSDTFFLYLGWATVFGTILLLRNLLNSRPGRAIRSLASGEGFAPFFGVRTGHYKLAVFVTAALLAGLSGWLYAHMLRFVNPAPFTVMSGIEYLFMIVIGGAAYLWGAVIGAFVVYVVKDILDQTLPGLLEGGGSLKTLVFAIVVVVLLQHSRGGIVRLFRSRFGSPAPIPVPAGDVRPPLRPKPAHTDALLDVKAVSKRFGGLVAVNKISLHLRSGEILGVIGPNGAGKSTLFNLMTGMLPSDGGTIRFDNRDITNLAPAGIFALGIARTFQHVQLRPEMSAIECVALGAHLRGHAGMIAAALRLNRAEEERLLSEAAHRLKEVGLGEHLLMPAGSLALGQQRLVEVARALASDPIVLMLDEPAAGLRYNEKQALMTVLKRVRDSGVSILIVEHDMEFVMQLVDRLMVMEFGAQIATGHPQEIQKDPRVIAAYLGEDA
jgi:branched-chain amino acid transport system permease protein